MDLNNDGTITEEETRKYNEMYAAMSAAHRAPRGTAAQVLRESDVYGLMLDRPASRQMQRSAAKWSRGKGLVRDRQVRGRVRVDGALQPVRQGRVEPLRARARGHTPPRPAPPPFPPN